MTTELGQTIRETVATESVGVEPQLSNEQKRQLLKPEVLAALSTEQYIDLWKQLNPYFLSHVTRQGMRDHSAMVYHSSGMGEFTNGFKNALLDQKLIRPPYALGPLQERTEDAVREWLGSWVLDESTEQKALDKLDKLMNFNFGAAPKYPDKTAVHFATEIVADQYYGAESGNEVFFIFPTDTIASQYDFAFNGKEKDFTKPQSETKWNDIFVWPQTVTNAGISIDAGFVFLPKSTLVDPQSGSKYASEFVEIDGKEMRVLIEDPEMVRKCIDWFISLDANSHIMQSLEALKSQTNYYVRESQSAQILTALQREIIGVGVSSETAAKAAEELFNEISWRQEVPEQVLESIFKGAGVQYQRPQNAVPAQEYWENFFAYDESLRPKHVVYYDGSPTNAVYQFQQEHGIRQQQPVVSEDKLLGFADRHVTDMEQDPRANKGKEELLATARKIITEHYRQYVEH